ncbi:MAG: hypothetical protein AB7O38_21415, partial [Pirellulaceae bacterium]
MQSDRRAAAASVHNRRTRSAQSILLCIVLVSGGVTRLAGQEVDRLPDPASEYPVPVAVWQDAPETADVAADLARRL